MKPDCDCWRRGRLFDATIDYAADVARGIDCCENDPVREEHYHLTMLAAKRLQTAPHGATLTH